MAFNIYYNHETLTRIAANVKQAVTDHRAHAEMLWRGGLDNWTNSDLADPTKQQGDAGVREVRIDVGQIKHLQELLRTISSRVLGAGYLRELADDLPNHAEDLPEDNR